MYHDAATGMASPWASGGTREGSTSMEDMFGWSERLAADPRRVVIIDDDPTGTQTVADVDVILQPAPMAYRQFLAGSDRAIYVMTNSRALPVEQARALVAQVAREVTAVAAAAHQSVAFILRGDSTLRGHVFAEVDALAGPDTVVLFVPAFPEGGRVTIDGVQHIVAGAERVPVSHTEFARDPVFGYRSERLVDWVRETGQERPALSLSLAELHTRGPEAVTNALLEAAPGTVVIPDAVTTDDVRCVAWGLLGAEARGRQVVVRSASTFAAIRAGLHGRSAPLVPRDGGRPLLVVCGSHVTGSSRQLQRLLERLPVAPVVIPTDHLTTPDREATITGLAARVRHDLRTRQVAVLASERERRPHHSDLTTASTVMAALVDVTALVAGEVGAVIAKGGITSAAVARDGFGAARARVLGQLEPGVSLWDLELTPHRRMPYAVIPGNVGDDNTLLHIAGAFGAPLTTPPPRLQRIEQRSMVTEITQRLLDYLLSDALRPGDRLPSERQLAEALGTGRSTLRESLKALTVLGLLDVRQGDGTYLKQRDSNLLPRVIEWGLLLGEQHTMDIVEARQRLEVVIAELAAERCTPQGVEELRAIVREMADALGSVEAFADADVAFHLKIAELARNQVLRDILASIRALLRSLTVRTIGGEGAAGAAARAQAYREHVPVFEAIERGNHAEAARAMEAHMRAGAQRLMRVIANAGGMPPEPHVRPDSAASPRGERISPSRAQASAD